MSVLRVHFRHKDPEKRLVDDYTFDIAVTTETKPVAKTAFVGLWGQFDNPANRFPLLLLSDGRIDLGENEDEKFRFQKTNIHQKEMKVGELVTVEEFDGQMNKERVFTLEISSVEVLGAHA